MSIYNEVLQVTIYHLGEGHLPIAPHVLLTLPLKVFTVCFLVGFLALTHQSCVLIQDLPDSVTHTVSITYGSLISLTLSKYLR